MANIVPTTYAFGAGGGAITNVTLQSRSVTTRMEKKTATGSDGEIIAVAFFGKIAEHKVELLDTSVISSLVPQAQTAKPSIVNQALGGTSYYLVEDVTIELTNDDFTKGNVTISEFQMED